MHGVFPQPARDSQRYVERAQRFSVERSTALYADLLSGD